MRSQLIYVLDDDDAVRVALGSFVRCLGFNVEIFSTAQQLLQSADLNKATCIISDVQMPGMTGFELLALLQQRSNPVPVILVTAFYEEHLKQKALGLGAVDFLSKPINSAAMISALEKLA